RLMPWEMPKRKRSTKSSSRAAHLAAAAVAIFVAAGILTIGALSLRAVAGTGTATESDFAVPALLGTFVPLLVLALGRHRLRLHVGHFNDRTGDECGHDTGGPLPREGARPDRFPGRSP